MVTGRGGAARSLFGVVVFAALVIWFGIVAPQRNRDATPPAGGQSTPDIATAPESGKSEADKQAAKPAQTAAPVSPEAQAAEAAKPEADPASADAAKAAPSFDVVRVEPNGEAVIAGRGAPGATIDMLRNGEPHARVMADASGLFAFVPPPLPPGPNEIVLQSIAPDGTRTRSRESVTALIAPDRKAPPLVALTAPDKPTVVLSAPEQTANAAPVIPPTPATPPVASAPVPGAPATGGPAPTSPDAAAASAPVAPAGPVAPDRLAVRIGSVETQAGGRLFVSGQAAPNATIRLYLNDSFVAPGGAGSDGRVSFAIEKGARPGDYRVRLDDVDPVSGRVRSRAEVAFTVPPAAIAAIEPPPSVPPIPIPPAPPPADRVAAPTATASGGAPGAPGAVPLSPDSRSGGSPPEAPPGSPASPARSAAGTPSAATDPGTIVVPEINTALVARGDNLWRISRRVYGQGIRYTVIYGANQPQIQNPSRIYPGQLFVLPAEEGAVR